MDKIIGVLIEQSGWKEVDPARQSEGFFEKITRESDGLEDRYYGYKNGKVVAKWNPRYVVEILLA